MMEHKQETLGIAQQEMLGNNPDMLLTEKGNARNLTNPREIYNILSCRTKSSEDFSIRLKQELVQSIQTPGVLPKLSRTASLYDIRHNPNKSDRLGNKPSHDLNSDKKFRVLILTRSKTGGEELTGIPEEVSVRTLNLPNISRNAISQGNIGLGGLKDEHSGDLVELPHVKDGAKAEKIADIGSKRKAEHPKNKLISVKEELIGSDSKLDKWFSEMPNEVFDKAQRALMEESIKDKLQTYQHKRSKKNHPPNQNLQLLAGSKSKRAQNTHIESVHMDSFGCNKPSQPDSGDKMNKYKLQQKSMHKLKMRDVGEIDRPDRSQQDIDLVPRLHIQQRAITTLALTKPKPTQAVVAKPKAEAITIPTDRGLKTVNINDRIELDGAQKCKTKQHVQNYEEYLERAHMKTDHLDGHVHNLKHNDENKGNDVENSDITSTLDTTKAKIINISLKKDLPTKRNPMHIQKTLEEKVCEDHEEIEQCTKDQIQVDCTNGDEVDSANKQNELGEEVLTRRDKIITKIPTAHSSRTSESKSTSSTIHSLTNRSVLKKFNKLEVFAESSKSAEATMMRRNYHSRKLRDIDYREVIPPSVRLDLKHYPGDVRRQVKEVFEPPADETKRPEVVFRFEPGEVIISAKKPNQSLTQSRASERARIIYGKVHGRDEKLRDRMGYMHSREGTRDNISHKSFNTKIAEQFKTEMVQFEARALNGSTSVASNGSKVQNGDINGVGTRDVGLETEIIGSEQDYQRDYTLVEDKPEETKKKPAIERNSSDLTDLMIDNNDGGDSLDTDTDNDLPDMYAGAPNHSV